MTAPEDQNGLREALARAVEAGASNGRTTTEIVDGLFVAGSPLASLNAERDADRASLRAAEAEITRLRAGLERIAKPYRRVGLSLTGRSAMAVALATLSPKEQP